eukprot:403375818
MDIKTYLFYPLSIILTSWAIYQVFLLKSHVDFIKNEAPECTQSNPNKLELMGGMVFLQVCLQYPVQSIAKSMFLKSLPQNKFPLGSKLRLEKAEMVAERIYKFFIQSVSTVGMFFILKQGNFLHSLLLGNQENPQYFVNYPCVKVPKHLDDVYVLKLTYHLYELFNTLIFLRDRRDFPEYVLHHIITLVLVLFSYSINILTIGSVIMFLTDFTDCFVSLFKITADVMSNKIQYTVAVVMVVVWIYLRVWFFPIHLMWEWFKQSTSPNHYVLESYCIFLFTFLGGLFVLHIFWLFLMFKGIVNRVFRRDSNQLLLESHKKEKCT